MPDFDDGIDIWKDVECPACKKFVPPEDKFCGWCGEVMNRNKSSDRLADLRDPETVAKRVYEYWIGSLRTDGILKDFDEWKGMDPSLRENLVEAIDECVVRPLDRIVSDMEVELSLAETGKALDKIEALPAPVAKWKYPGQICYYCGHGDTVRDGACRRCLEGARE